MGYAEVSVNSPIAKGSTFSYKIPPHMDIAVGHAVRVPFGNRVLQGVVLELTDHPAVEETRDIEGIMDPRPLLTPPQIDTARWISRYYLSPLFDAVQLFLPPGFQRRAIAYYQSPNPYPEEDTSTLTPNELKCLKLVQEKGRLSAGVIEKHLGKSKAGPALNKLVRRGFFIRDYEMEKPRVRPRIIPHLELAVTPHEAAQEQAGLTRRGANKQAALLKLLLERAGPVPWPQARTEAAVNKGTADALKAKGLISYTKVEMKRRPLPTCPSTPSTPPKISADQHAALKAITKGLDNIISGEPDVFLLHGVTASGKTEVYLRALAETIRRGQKGIVLVPEIALTPQTIERFEARFPGRVAVLHSGLSLGEQHDEWHRIRNGECDVAIGPRSAIFAPQPNLGLIVIDEEHEWTYKQQDKSPRYHARRTAVELARRCGAVVVMGSATPDVETYYKTLNGRYQLLEMPYRVAPHQGAPLPEVEVVDMRRELKAGNRSIFSRPLMEALSDTVVNGKQAILFLNRRGGANFIQCRTCGFVLKCKRCDTPLSYHPTEDAIRCHQCNYRAAVPQACPQCMGRRIKFLGIGTQKLAAEAACILPQARLLRWDSDATRTKGAHKEILDRFRGHKADILIGTQMVAKGLDLPLVTLVGVVSADTALNLPDFRAGERTFQLLSQVLGRAGRGGPKGRVIIQTYSPEHYAIKTAAAHDYASFFKKEIEHRGSLGNPPFSQLARMLYSHTNDAHCQREVDRLARRIKQNTDTRGINRVDIIGPAPAFVHRLRGRYRWQIILRGDDLSALLQAIPLPQGWLIDVDPIGIA